MSAWISPFEGRWRMRLLKPSGKQAPAKRLPGVERNQAFDLLRHFDLGAPQRDRLLIDRKIVEERAVDRREALQLVERPFLLEHARIAFEGVRRVEDPRAAAGGFLGVAR